MSDRRVAKLFGSSFVACQEAISALEPSDIVRVHAAGELMAISADIEIMAPSLAADLLAGPHAFIAAYERGRQLPEFKVRWTIRRLLANREDERRFLADEEFHRLDDDLSEADRMIENARGFVGILEINAAVTRTNLIRAAGFPISQRLKHKASRLVSRAGDTSQAYRLRYGARSAWY